MNIDSEIHEMLDQWVHNENSGQEWIGTGCHWPPSTDLAFLVQLMAEAHVTRQVLTVMEIFDEELEVISLN